jgi:hypothetical protein
MLIVSARSSTDGSSWSTWSDLSVSGSAPGVPDGRYLQYRLTLATGDTQVSPVVNSVTASYH